MGTTQHQFSDSNAARVGKPKSKFRLFFRRFCLTVLGVVTVLLAWYAIARFADLRAIKRLQASLQQQGEPLTVAELAKWYPSIPEEENAASALLEVWKQVSPEFWASYLDKEKPTDIRSGTIYDANLPYFGSDQVNFQPAQALTPDVRQAAEDFLKARSAHLEAIRAALQRPRCRFPIEIEDGAFVKLSHLMQLKTEAEAFRIVVLLAADRRDVATALSTIDSMVRLADTLRTEPNELSQLVRVNILQHGIAATEELLGRAPLDAGQIKHLRELWAGIDTQEILRLSLQSAAAFGLSLFDLPKRVVVAQSQGADAREALMKNRLGKRILGLLGVTAIDKRFMLEVIEQSCVVRQLDYPEQVRRAEKLHEESDRRLYGFPPKLISMMATPMVRSYVTRAADLEAQKRCLLTALGIKQSMLVAGAVPENLDGLIPTFISELPKDPFDGQPLRYQRRPTGFIVYSIGSDLRDDGGNRKRSHMGRIADLVVAVEKTD
jgi:hypothetical protein